MSLYHWIWLTQQVPNSAQAMRLLDIFQKPERIYLASREQLLDSGVLRKEQCFQLSAAHSLDPAVKVVNDCADNSVRILTIQDALYPSRLKSIPDPPVILYVRGVLPLFDELLSVALVGTRHASQASLGTAENFAYTIGQQGYCHISGMADGIDAAGHRGALRAGAMSVAVFGCGPDVCYPSVNRPLMRELLDHGCILSEYPPGTQPTRYTFPRRNRIIAGLANGVLLVCAPVRSGSLITANLATDFGRDVFVVPGGINDPEYGGSNALIKDGAMPVTSPEDIIQFYSDSVSYAARFRPRVPQSEYYATRSEQLRETQRNPADTSPTSKASSESESVPEGSEEKPPVSSPRSITARQHTVEKRTTSATADKPSRVASFHKSTESSDSQKENLLPETNTSRPVLAEKDRNPANCAVFDAVCGGLTIPDLIIAKTGLSVDDALQALTDLEIMGYLRSAPGGNMVLNQK